MTETQLTLDGREVPVLGPDQTRAHAPLTGSQREILVWIRDHGHVRSIEAGAIVHAARTPPCGACARARNAGRPCCGYASSDGSDALKRLLARGLVVHCAAPGVWRAASPPRTPAERDAQLKHESAWLEHGMRGTS